MDRALDWVDDAIEQALSGPDVGPPRLARAIRYAVFPGGSRFRPRLSRAVHDALGAAEPEAFRAAAVAVELVHCASLVHDDLPCFDDADRRRGRPSVHRQFDEATAVLVGDALIVLGFQSLASSPHEVAPMLRELSRCTGHPHGIIAGQAWEAEPHVSLLTYHQAKTAALFEAACALGALAAREDPAPWRTVGRLLGQAYQIADDVADVSGADFGKSAARDVHHGRPNAAMTLGSEESVRRVEQLLSDAADAVPTCAAREDFQRWISTASLGVLGVRSRFGGRGRSVASSGP